MIDYEVSCDPFPSVGRAQRNVFLRVLAAGLHCVYPAETAAAYLGRLVRVEAHPWAMATRVLESRKGSGQSGIACQTCKNRSPSKNGKSWCVRLRRCPEGRERSFAHAVVLLGENRAGIDAVAADGRWDSCCDCEEDLLAATLICCLLFA